MKNGLHVTRTLTCPCGKAFETKNPSGTYCSTPCRIRYGRFGRTYGHYMPKNLGTTRS